VTVTEPDDRKLVNPYQNGRPRRLSEQLGRAGVLRRRFTQLVVFLVSLALVGGTVATSCGANTAAPTDVGSLGQPAR
jgi:hypothetical protein